MLTIRHHSVISLNIDASQTRRHRSLRTHRPRTPFIERSLHRLAFGAYHLTILYNFQLRFQFFTQGKRDFWETHTEAEAREHLRSDPDRYQFADTDARAVLATLGVQAAA